MATIAGELPADGYNPSMYELLKTVNDPAELRQLDRKQLPRLADELTERLAGRESARRRVHGGHRRLQVGHDDGTGKTARGIGQHGGQRRAVAQVQVPVVGAGDR